MNYYQPEFMLPFFRGVKEEEAWQQIGQILNPEIQKKYHRFFDDYQMYFKSYTIVKQRYLFFLKVLNRDHKIMNSYGEKMGDDIELTARVAYAIHHCILNGEVLLAKLDEIIKDFPVKCLEIEKREKLGQDITYDSLNVHPPASDCEKTGICSCIGSNLPYMRSCIDDPTILWLDRKTAEKLI